MNKKHDKKNSSPVVRLRYMFVGILLIMAAISGPLLLVWKQSYINQVSIRLENMNGSLAEIDRDIAALRLECEKLSATSRIERVARENLELEYPSSDQIVIINGGEEGKSENEGGISRLFAWVRHSITGERG
ncbi:MAG: cell division protein FtsL [Chitinispirillaceae bacterium]